MTEVEFVDRLNALYAQYREVAKPLLALVEASFERFPIPIYNEVRSLTDHISRCFSTEGGLAADDIVKSQLDKAEHHIKRVILDCYKVLNIHEKQRVEDFERRNKHIDLRTADADGTFSARYYDLQKQSVEAVNLAKRIEATGDDEKTYRAFEGAYNTYTALTDYIEVNRRLTERARAKFWSGKVLWMLWSLVTFILGCVLTNNNKAIIEFLSSALG